MIEIQPDGRFGRFLYEALEKSNKDVKQIAKDVESTYEHMRKLIKGLAFPSPYMIQNLAKVLDFDEKEAQLLVDQDKVQNKFSKTFSTLTGKNPELDPIEKEWPVLNDQQKESIYTMVQAFAKQNRSQLRKTAK